MESIGLRGELCLPFPHIRFLPPDVWPLAAVMTSYYFTSVSVAAPFDTRLRSCRDTDGCWKHSNARLALW